MQNEEKNPHISKLKIWILIIIVTQAISSAQNYWVHQQMRDSILETDQHLLQSLKAQSQYNESANRLFDQLLIREKAFQC